MEKPIIAKTSWYAFLANDLDVSLVRYYEDSVTIQYNSEKPVLSIPTYQISAMAIEPWFLNNQLIIRTSTGKIITVKGLQEKESQKLYAAVQKRVLHHKQVQKEAQEARLKAQQEKKAAEQARRQPQEARLEAQREKKAAEQAHHLTPQIINLDQSLRELLSTEHYTRHSQTSHVEEAAKQITRLCTQRVSKHLSHEAQDALKRIKKLGNPENLESTRKKSNQTFVSEQVKYVLKATQDILPNGLTTEQARNIATDEDSTLVLAGAGTGKTSVIIGKIAHLVRNQGIPPESILALAFNRKAAMEIRERLPEDLKGAYVSTFHSFGLRVVSDSNVAPIISKMAQDDFAFNKAIDGIIQKMLSDPKLSRTVLELITILQAEYRNPFEFKTKQEYEHHIYNCELRTLNGKLVKSFEELTIANFMRQNSIQFDHEVPYEIRTSSSQHRQYLPDFYLPKYDIYIEHFALDEQGHPPPTWKGYAEGVEWKRKIHRKYGTQLIETYSWQHRREILLTTLKEKLEERGVKFKPVPTEELIAQLSQERISWLANLLRMFLRHVKSGDLTNQEIELRSRNVSDRERTAHFLEIFFEIRHQYQAVLEEEQALDFHDLINAATNHIRKNNWNNPYQYVLIDEFQDISRGRMALARALKKPGLAYFLVGDDWQSIYRFTGSDVGLINHCDDHLGYTQRESLTRTFRFGDGILKPSTAFIQRNPEQTSRELEADHQEDDRGITIISKDKPENGLIEALNEIKKTISNPTETIMVLGRYRSSLQTAMRLNTRNRQVNIQYNTIHRAKGQEADYVIILGLKDGQYGFPCRVEDDPLLDIVMPPIQDQRYEFAEERRLFYVALTRARKGLFLITDLERPSPFIRELIDNSPEIKQLRELKTLCQSCNRGSLTLSKSGNNLRCSNFPRCRYLSPRCPNCNTGYARLNLQRTAAECSNPTCSSPPEICPRCQEGILVKKKTEATEFWGCSRFQADPPCTFTHS